MFNLSKACLVFGAGTLTKCHVLTPEGILCTRNNCCSMVCSHTMAVCCTLKTNMFLFVLYFNFFPHLEILGGSQFILRNLRGVPVPLWPSAMGTWPQCSSNVRRTYFYFSYRKNLVIFKGVPVKKNTLFELSKYFRPTFGIQDSLELGQ